MGCLVELPNLIGHEAVDATAQAQTTIEALGRVGAAAGASQERLMQQLMAEIAGIDASIRQAEKSITEDVVYAKLKLPPAIVEERPQNTHSGLFPTCSSAGYCRQTLQRRSVQYAASIGA